MAAPRTWPTEHREAVTELVLEHGETVANACRKLAAGHNELEPLTIPPATATEWVRQARMHSRPVLEGKTPSQAASAIVWQILEATNEEVTRIRGTKGAIDADQLLKLANTVKTLEPLLKPEPKASEGNKPASFLAALPETQHVDDNDTRERKGEARTGDRSLAA